jgi:hypothetical protein
MTTQPKSTLRTAAKLLKHAVLATLFAAAVSIAVNLLRSEGLPFWATKPYDILVPCPEPGGEVREMPPGDPRIVSRDTFIVDARTKEAFANWHLENAESLTYDYLDPVPDAEIVALSRAIAASRAKRVAVYGDGLVPDTGEQLGKELSGKGIKNVFFVEGGAPALENASKETAP